MLYKVFYFYLVPGTGLPAHASHAPVIQNVLRGAVQIPSRAFGPQVFSFCPLCKASFGLPKRKNPLDFIEEVFVPGTGFSSHASHAQKILNGGFTQVPYPLRGLDLFVCLLRRTSSPRIQTKSPTCLRQAGPCARDWIRTSTWFPTLRPEHSASTNFATRAS